MAKDSGLPSFLLGLGVGIGVGLLFAPKAGSETRELLKGKADEGKEYLKRRSTEPHRRLLVAYSIALSVGHGLVADG